MTTIYLFFAVIGSTILVCQFVLTLIGLGTDSDIPDDLPDEVPADLHLDGADGAGHDALHGHDSSWLFGVISFRTLVAAFAFFGLAGLAAQGAGAGTPVQLIVALASGLAAMFAVHWLMRMLGKLSEDATAKVHRAMGQEGTVYIPIAAHNERAGKVQLKVASRLMEYEAITEGEKLATGTRIRVVAVRGNVLQVEPVGQEAIAKTA